MSKFLKLAIVPLAFLLAGTATSCTVSPKEIALITDVGDINDGSFNQESWEACKEFAVRYHKSYDFYRPFNDSEFARNCAVKQAVAKGAQVVVLPGFKFASTCANVMAKYPSVHFLLIDSYVHNGDYNAIDPTDNVACVGFKCEYSGFIAGYSIATDLMQRDFNEKGELLSQYGYGYIGGMASSGVYEFGFGYIQGICQATADFCKNHNLTKPKIVIQYDYALVFAQDDKATIKVKSWYTSDDGIKVVFPCGGKLYQSVTEAAQYYNKHQHDFNYNDWFKGKLDKNPRTAARWVGVDSDQYRGLTYDHEIKSIYTSALKGLNPAIMNALKFHYDNEWWRIGGTRPIGDVKGGGEIAYGSKWVLGLHSIFGEFESQEQSIPDDYVGIPKAFDGESKVMRGFDNYTFSDYEDLYARLTRNDDDRIKVSGDSGAVLDEKQIQIPGGWHDYDLTIAGGYPYDMVHWTKEIEGEKHYYREDYLGDYPEELIDIRSPKS